MLHVSEMHQPALPATMANISTLAITRAKHHVQLAYIRLEATVLHANLNAKTAPQVDLPINALPVITAQHTISI